MNMEKKELIWVSTVFPDPPTDGNSLRNFNILSELAKYYTIHFFSYRQGKEPANLNGRLAQICASIHTIPLNNRTYSFFNKVTSRIRSLAHVKPGFAVSKDESSLKKAIEACLRDHHIACVISISPWVTFTDLSNRTVPVIMDEQNVEFLRLKELSAIEKNPVRKFSRFLDYRTMRSYELKLIRTVNAVTVVSDADALRFKNLYPDREYPVVPNGVDTEYWKFDFKRSGTKKIVFSGGMSYFPNHDAMEFFLKSIYPLVLKSDPAVQLTIAGKNPQPELISLARSFQGSVTCTGFLNDIRPSVYEASVCIVPIRAGGGTRLKILEAMAAGVPVVSTSKGAEGLAVVDKEHLLIADTPESFTNAVITLLSNDDVRYSLASHARKLVEGTYSWVSIAGLMKKTIDSCMNEKA